ncbi:methionyl-tRNA formyltransferase [soil metagenome]
MTAPVRTVFLGSGDFAVTIAESVAAHPAAKIVAVVSAPPRPGPRGRTADPPVVGWALSGGMPLLRPARLRSDAAIDRIRSLEPELIVLADYGQIVPAEVLALPRYGALNVHPSLLPRHRGATPVAAAILAGDSETGVSLMLMDAGLDSGPLIAQRRVSLTGGETAPDLEQRLAVVSGELLAESLESWLAGGLAARAQPDEGVTLTRSLHREDGRLDPTLDPAALERQVRAYQPWPGSFFDTDSGRVVVWKARPAAQQRDPKIGQLVALADNGLGLTAGGGTFELLEVQPAGGRRMTASDLLRGRPGLAGAWLVGPVPADDHA